MRRLFQMIARTASRVVSYSIVCLAIVVTVSSCNYIDPNINVDPNNPANASMSNLLRAAEVSVAYTFSGDMNRYSSLLTQHHVGIDRQHLGITNYAFVEANVTNLWNNFYANCLKNILIITRKGNETSSPHFRGVSRTLAALTLGNLTDTFGDVPYSQAFKGEEALQAGYDKQEQLYGVVQSELDSAIADLNSTVSAFAPTATDDIIYSGRRPNWVRAAWSLKARYALHLSKRNRMQAAQQALDFAAKGFQSNADNLVVTFGTTPANANPLQQFVAQRGDIRMGAEFIATLAKLKDPRQPLLVQTTNGDPTFPGRFYASSNSPVDMMTFAELKFIQAEANLILGKNADAKAAYLDGVKAALARMEVAQAAIDTYVAQTSVVPTGDITLEQIIAQKYIALYMNIESWTDWRRTGFPVLKPTTGNAIPRRFPYPDTERLYNVANWTAAGGTLDARAAIFGRVWWDVQ